MAALAERRIIPHEELQATGRARAQAQADAEVRPEHLRLLEALLFAAAVPLDEKTLGARLPEDVDLKASLRALQAEYSHARRQSRPHRQQVDLPHRRRPVVAARPRRRWSRRSSRAPRSRRSP